MTHGTAQVSSARFLVRDAIFDAGCFDVVDSVTGAFSTFTSRDVAQEQCRLRNRKCREAETMAALHDGGEDNHAQFSNDNA